MEDTLVSPSPTPVIDHTIGKDAPTRIVSYRPSGRDGRIDREQATSVFIWTNDKGDTIYTDRHYDPKAIEGLHDSVAREKNAFKSLPPDKQRMIDADFRKYGKDSTVGEPYLGYLTSHRLHETVLEIEKKSSETDHLKGGF